MPTSVYDPKQDDQARLSHAGNPGAEHERQMLEDMYNAPSASNSGSQRLSRQQLNDKEGASAGGFGAHGFRAEKDAVNKFGIGGRNGGKEAESDQVGKGFSDGDGKKKIQSNKRRRTIAGWVAASIITAGGGAGISGTLSGPLQYIQAANLFHGISGFEEAEDNADNRMMLIARLIREPNKPQNLRMGILANKYADKIEARLNRGGFTSAYTERLGYLKGYFVEKSKFSGDFSGLKDKPDAEIRQHFRRAYSVDVSTVDGKMFIEGKQLDQPRRFRILTSAVMQSSGSGKIAGSVKARMMGHRAGIDWHPMKKDNKTGRSVEARYLKWRDARKLKISQGVQSSKPTVEKKPSAANGEGAQASADGVEGSVNEAANQAENAKTTGNMTELNEKMNGIKNGTVGGVVAVGLVCLIHGVAVNVDNIEQANVIKPLIRVYGDVLAFGNQIMFGDGDVDVEQMGFMQNQMYDPKTKTSWDQAAPIQAETGQNQSGPDINKTIRESGDQNAIVQFFGKVPGLEQVCDAAGTTAGQVVMVLAGGINLANAVITGLFYAFGDEAIDGISRWLAGEPVDPLVAGAPFGASAVYGGKYAARDFETTQGGRDLDGTETISLKQSRDEKLAMEFKNKPLSYRLFNATDHRTLVGSIIHKQKPDAKANATAVATNILNFGNVIASVPETIFAKKAGAVRPYTYPMKDRGYSPHELLHPIIADPWANQCQVFGCPEKGITGLLEGDDGEDRRERVEKCFGMEMGTDGTVVSTGTMPTDKDRKDNNCNQAVPEDEDCTPETDACKWLRIRIALMDVPTLEAYTCYMGDAESCANVNFNSADSPGTDTGDLGEEEASLPNKIRNNIANLLIPNSGALP